MPIRRRSRTLIVDEVVLALGHLDAEPDADGAAAARFAARHGLVYLPPGHTAELDLSVLEPGADVIALGFGQAFTDLLVLVTEGRGGRFVDDGDGAAVRAERARADPPRRVAARRAVPLEDRLPPAGPGRAAAALPRRRDDRAPASPAGRSTSGATCCHSSSRRSAGRTTTSCSTPIPSARPNRGTTFAARFADADAGRDSAARRRRRRVPDRRRPVRHRPRSIGRCTGRSSSPPTQLHDHVGAHVVADVARRTDPALQRRPRRVQRSALGVRRARPPRCRRALHPTLPRRRRRHLVVQLLHVLRQRAAARSPAPTPGPRRCRPRPLPRRRARR